MIVICGIGLLTILVLLICTIPYKKSLRKKLSKAEYNMTIFYGIAMFIVDRIPKKLWDRNSMVDRSIRQLRVKENIHKDKYLYAVEKTSISLVVIIVTLVIGIAYEVSNGLGESNKIDSLKRNDSGITSYEFIAQNEDGKQENISVDIGSKSRTEKEIYQLIEDKKNVLLKEVLGSNKGLEKINRKLNLVDSVGDDVSVFWTISDTDIINYEGEISENVPKAGKNVEIIATMMVEDVSQDYKLEIVVFPSAEEKNVQQQLQSYVDENDIYDDNVKLPDSINGIKTEYFFKKENYGALILIVGVIGAVAIFILKDQDLKKDIKKRNSQLLMDYPEIVGKVMLYYNAGLSIKSSVERMVHNYKKEKDMDNKVFRYAYEELEMALIKMKSGVSEIEAINEYGSRCGLHCYIKFSGIIEQNLRRGANEMLLALKSELNNAMFERKNVAMKEGGEISTKLLGPMIVMLIITILIIMVPALLSIKN